MSARTNIDLNVGQIYSQLKETNRKLQKFVSLTNANNKSSNAQSYRSQRDSRLAETLDRIQSQGGTFDVTTLWGELEQLAVEIERTRDELEMSQCELVEERELNRRLNTELERFRQGRGAWWCGTTIVCKTALIAK